jgi:hypothetical protein
MRTLAELANVPMSQMTYHEQQSVVADLLRRLDTTTQRVYPMPRVLPYRGCRVEYNADGYAAYDNKSKDLIAKGRETRTDIEREIDRYLSAKR